jgi:hypothetical protein
MVGHDDDGYLIATVYTKLAQRRAIARTQRPMDATSNDKQHAHRAYTPSPNPKLRRAPSANADGKEGYPHSLPLPIYTP